MFNNETLNIITPFKGNAIQELKNTVNSLIIQNYLKVNHILVIDREAYVRIINFFENIEITNNNYLYTILISDKKGIYSSINQALDTLSDYQLYLVLGAGDILKLNSKVNFDSHIQIFYFSYSLSSNVENLINKFRNIFLGMPYCHNALIFRKNKLRYNQFYNLSGDFDYYLNYKNYSNFKKKLFKKNLFMKEIKSGYIIYESKNGISSQKKWLVNMQNLLIIFKNYSIIGLFIYLFLFLNKSFNKMFMTFKIYLLELKHLIIKLFI
mgnify:CR=1 FL=1